MPENNLYYTFRYVIPWKAIYTTVFYSLTLLGLILYIGWLIHLISQALHLRRLRRDVKEENFEQKYRYKTEFYKYILLTTITLIEPLNFLMRTLAFLFNQLVHNMNHSTSIVESLTPISIELTLKTLAYVFGLVLLSLLNILTIYLSYVILAYTEFSPVKRKIRNLAILASFLLLSTFVFIIGTLLVQFFTLFYAIYEYFQLIKNTKYLYRLLKSNYKSLIYENYSFCREYKYKARTYKCYMSILLVFFANVAAEFLLWNVEFTNQVICNNQFGITNQNSK